MAVALLPFWREEADLALVDCRYKLEYETLPAEELPMRALGACLYDFLAFIDSAERPRVRGKDGLMKTGRSFLDVHMELYAERTRRRMARALPPPLPFTSREADKKLDRALHAERILLRQFIDESRKKRSYYVERLVVDFDLPGGYDFETGKYTIRAVIRSDETVRVFHGECELRVPEMTHLFTFAATEEEARLMALKTAPKQIVLKRYFYLEPGAQGVYDTSWLFDETRMVATALIRLGPGFALDLEREIKKWLLTERQG